jgi:hypothetical protein
MAYLLARVLGFIVLPWREGNLDLKVATDAAIIEVIEKLGSELLNSVRALIKIPAIRHGLEASVVIRCSRVPLTIRRKNEIEC